MKKLLVLIILLTSQFVFANNEIREMSIADKANVLAMLATESNLHDSVKADIAQLFSDAVYDYRASVTGFECNKIGRSSLVDCKIDISLDIMSDSDSGWGSVYRIHVLLNDRSSFKLLKASFEGLAG